jgi:hypothetical protein
MSAQSTKSKFLSLKLDSYLSYRIVLRPSDRQFYVFLRTPAMQELRISYSISTN